MQVNERFLLGLSGGTRGDILCSIKLEPESYLGSIHLLQSIFSVYHNIDAEKKAVAGLEIREGQRSLCMRLESPKCPLTNQVYQ